MRNIAIMQVRNDPPDDPRSRRIARFFDGHPLAIPENGVVPKVKKAFFNFIIILKFSKMAFLQSIKRRSQ